MDTARRSDLEERFERVAALAQAGLQRWASFVRPLPLVLVPEDQRVALRSLVNWYERVCVDESYEGSAPPEGLEVLGAFDGSHSRTADDPVKIAHGAVRLAEDLVDYRQLLGGYRHLLQDGERPREGVEETVLSQLEVATLLVSQLLEVS